MSYRGWAPLWNTIVDSSLWMEDDTVVKVFLTMLALKDADHVFRGSAFSLARKAYKTEEEVLRAWQVLSMPDKLRKEKQDFDGRRIEAVEEGWLILNGEKYREMVQKEMKRSNDRKAARAYRQRQKVAKNAALKQPLPPSAAERAYSNGADIDPGAEQERRLAEMKPDKNIKVPKYVYLSEGYDPAKAEEMNRRSS